MILRFHEIRDLYLIVSHLDSVVIASDNRRGESLLLAQLANILLDLIWKGFKREWLIIVYILKNVILILLY